MALIGASTIAALGQKADLSGTWDLNIAKSFLAGEHPASDYRFSKIFVQQDNLIQQTDIVTHASIANISLPDSKISTEIVADGKEHQSKAAQITGLPATTAMITAVWQGCTLEVTEEGKGLLGLSTTHRRYFLSDDGTQLIELVQGQTGFGDTEQRLVFDKRS
jgi:hypothetical protein